MKPTATTRRPPTTPTLTRRQLLRRLGAIGLTATAALGVACRSGTTTGQTSPSGGGPSGELRVWVSGTPEVEAAMRKIAQEYMAAKPATRLIVENFPFNQYYQKLITAFTGDAGPDVYWVDVRTAEFAKLGALLPLDQFLTREWLDDIFPIALGDGVWGGRRYAVPMHELANGMFVNTKVFQDTGIRVPRDIGEAWTWDQLREYAIRLTERSGGATTRWGFGSQRTPGDWTVLPYIHQNAGQALSPDLKQATDYLNGPPAVEALTYYGGLYTTDGAASASLPPDAFPTGKVAIFDAVSTYVIALKPFAGFEYDIAPAPRQKQMAVMTGGYNVGINSATKQAEACWDVVDYMTRVKHAQWAVESGYLPCRRSVIEADPKYAEHPWKLFLDELEQAAIHRPPTPVYAYFFDVFEAAAKDITVGANVKASLDKAATRLDPRLATS